MAVPLTDGAKRILDGLNFAHVVTLMEDGSPQSTPVWVEHDGTHVVFNTAEGRVKPRNIRRDARVAVSVVDSENPYDYVEVRGRVVEMTTEGGWEHINKLARKYRGPDAVYATRSGKPETRLIVRIEPDFVGSH